MLKRILAGLIVAVVMAGTALTQLLQHVGPVGVGWDRKPDQGHVKRESPGLSVLLRRRSTPIASSRMAISR
jgi:hypothetical protein